MNEGIHVPGVNRLSARDRADKVQAMPTFSAFDGTLLSYRTIGEGEPLVCLPGGPFQDSVYLGDLGGLARHRQLILLDLRGTGGSAVPDDPSSYRCDRLVDDVEALRAELGLTTMDLLSHSAGVNLAVLYAARHPGNVRRLVLVGPSVFGVGITVTGETRRAVAQLRKDEPWYPAAWAALDAITSGNAGDDDWAAIAPFGYGRWDEAAQRTRRPATPRPTRRPPRSSPPTAPSTRQPPGLRSPPSRRRCCWSRGSTT